MSKSIVDLKKSFNLISQNYCKGKNKSLVCDDNMVATVVYNNNKWEYDHNYIIFRVENRDEIKISNKKNEYKRIIIILESPHIEEYSYDIIAPSMGITGKNLDAKLIDILNTTVVKNSLDNENKYEIIIMNAIQYQTSLGFDTEIFRDRLWLTMWIKGQKRVDFIKRLKIYQPDIILNFCTNGSHKKELFYKSNIKAYMKSIRYSFIYSLKLNITQEQANGMLKIGNDEVCNASNNGNKQKKSEIYMYKLYDFVNKEIEKANRQSIIKNVDIYIGPHPSSRHFLSLKYIKKV